MTYESRQQAAGRDERSDVEYGMSGPRPAYDQPTRDSTNVPLTVGLTIAALFFGSEIFVPIAMAILLSFVLAPGVRLLRGWHLGRVFPVLAMTLLAFVVTASIGGVIAVQIRDLSTDFPRYQATVRQKTDMLRGMLADHRLKQITDFLASLSQDAPRQAESAGTSPGTPEPAVSKPLAVVVRQAEPTTFDMMGRLLTPLLHPLATAGIVVIFVVFILLQREDLRNRVIRLVGAGDLHRSTAALDDAARRLSRFLLSQLAVNAASGVLVGGVLMAIGIPSPVLWGIVFACLRFVPYLGPPLAAILPICLAAAVDPGWSMIVWTIAAFAIIELVVGQAVEPVLYGHHTGLSPVAVVLAATFWTSLWGPIGLLLSTPITVCLVVLGRHVEHLRVFDLLLGDRPPLKPPEAFYQRMLAEDPIEAADQAHLLLRDTSLTDYYDEVLLPGLLLAQDDVAQGRLDTGHQQRIAAACAELVDDLADAAPDPESRTLPSLIGKISGRAEEPVDAKAPAESETAAALPAGWRDAGAVLCIGSRGPLDDAAALVLSQLLEKQGFGTRAAAHGALLKSRTADLDFSGARLIALSCLDGRGTAYLRFVLRRLRRRAPQASVLVCTWWRAADGHGSTPEDAAGDAKVSTFSEAVTYCVGHASAETPPQAIKSKPPEPEQAVG